jgi:putative cardiolipin synthase
MAGRFLRLSAAAFALALAACTQSDLRPDYVRPPSISLAPQPDAPLVIEANRLATEHSNESGLRLLGNPIDALISRIALADHAKYSIDLQYYIYHADATGKLLAQHLIMAADRGVRVRVLLDDLHEVGHDPVLRALDAHPHVEIRLFNPFHERSGGAWGMGKQFARDFSRLNRRMHNKAFIVDGAGAVIGGRNIGDEYFDASGNVNFRDLDVLLIGPVVAEVAHVFDDYWNSDPSVPIDAFRQREATADIDALRKSLEANAAAMRDTPFGKGLVAETGDVRSSRAIGGWAWGEATFLADSPDKVTPDVDDAELHLAPRVREWLDGARERALLISPYFIPRDKGVAYLAKMRERGVAVEVLTNSLSSTDADGVYAAYASYVPSLLAAGVTIYELKPNAERTRKQKHQIASTESASSLHAKAIVVDADKSFIGSMNLDPRSHSLNTEDGVIVTSPAIAEQLAHTFAQATEPSVTYEVKLKQGSTSTVYWETKENGETVLYDAAPRTSGWRRFKAGFSRVLPVEGLL